jgi:hypothetical protein
MGAARKPSPGKLPAGGRRLPARLARGPPPNRPAQPVACASRPAPGFCLAGAITAPAGGMTGNVPANFAPADRRRRPRRLPLGRARPRGWAASQSVVGAAPDSRAPERGAGARAGAKARGVSDPAAIAFRGSYLRPATPAPRLPVFDSGLHNAKMSETARPNAT